MIRAIFFDLDNTLADRVVPHRRYCERFADRFLSHLTAERQRVAVEEMVAQDRLGYTDRAEFCEWVASRFPVRNLTGASVWEDYRSRLPRLFRTDGRICELVDRLAEKYTLAVVTNGSAVTQRAKLSRTQLAERFSHIVISGEWGVEKPSPEIFHRALAAVECSPSQALFIGDDPVNDIAGAKRVGMRTCWVSLGRSFPRHLRRPDQVVGSLWEWKGP